MENFTSVIAELEEGLEAQPFGGGPWNPAVYLAKISDQVGQAGRAAWRSAQTRQEFAGMPVRTSASHPAVFRTRMICVALLAVEAATGAEGARQDEAPRSELRRTMIEALETDVSIVMAPRALEDLQLDLLRDLGSAASTIVLLERVGRFEPGAERALDTVRGGHDRALAELRDEYLDIAVSAVRAAAAQRPSEAA